jgi:rhomboid-like protein
MVMLSSKVLLRPVAAMRAHQGLPVLLRSSISNSSGVGKRQISLALKNSGNGNKRQLSSFLRPSHHGGLDNGRKVLIGIVGVNTGVFAVWKWAEMKAEQSFDYSLLNFMRKHFIVHSGDLTNGRWHTLLTSTISHQDLFHFGLNMLAAYSFGSNVIGLIGTASFLALYVGSGILSSLVVAAYPRIINQPYYQTAGLGASGSVYAIVSYFILTFPTATVFVIVFPAPAALIGVGLVGYECYQVWRHPAAAGSSAAHLTGAAMGTTYWFMKRFRSGGSSWIRRIR